MLARPTTLLRIEGAALLLATVYLYARSGGPWWLFGLLLFAPDLAMIGYARGPRAGAALYNLAHLTALPIALAVVAFVVGHALLLQVALVWLAHVGLDRTFGYGLKFPSAFGDTHLGRIGEGGRDAADRPC